MLSKYFCGILALSSVVLGGPLILNGTASDDFQIDRQLHIPTSEVINNTLSIRTTNNALANGQKYYVCVSQFISDVGFVTISNLFLNTVQGIAVTASDNVKAVSTSLIDAFEHSEVTVGQATRLVTTLTADASGATNAVWTMAVTAVEGVADLGHPLMDFVSLPSFENIIYLGINTMLNNAVSTSTFQMVDDLGRVVANVALVKRAVNSS